MNYSSGIVRSLCCIGCLSALCDVLLSVRVDMSPSSRGCVVCTSSISICSLLLGTCSPIGYPAYLRVPSFPFTLGLFCVCFSLRFVFFHLLFSYNEVYLLLTSHRPLHSPPSLVLHITCLLLLRTYLCVLPSSSRAPFCIWLCTFIVYFCRRVLWAGSFD